MSDQPFPPCIDCEEPESGTCPEQRCRDCDIDYITSRSACRECYTWIIREDVGGPLSEQHKPGCSLANDPNYSGRNEEERRAVRIARCGWAPPLKDSSK